MDEKKTSLADWLDSGQKIAWFFGIIITISGTVALAFHNIKVNADSIDEIKKDMRNSFELYEQKQTTQHDEMIKRIDKRERETDKVDERLRALEIKVAEKTADKK